MRRINTSLAGIFFTTFFAIESSFAQDIGPKVKAPPALIHAPEIKGGPVESRKAREESKAPLKTDEVPTETAPEPAETKVEPVIAAPAPEPVSEEVKLMQAIEPNFVPQESRAVELFLLQKQVSENDEKIKATEEKAKNIRPMLGRKFREDLSKYSTGKIAEVEAKYNGSMKDLINQYETALKNNPDNSIYSADALYFLGNYYFEVDEKIYFDLLAKYNEAREQGREDVPYPEENFSRSIDTYESLIEKFPEYRHMDSVYYMLAMALWYEGAFSNAVDNFKTLIAKFPKSKYVEEVWFRLGEYHYDMDDYDDAIADYSVVAKNKKSPLYDKSLYKIAWAHFQKDRYALAIENFLKVLDLTYSEKDSAVDSGMRAEVTRYIVKSFADEILEEEQVLHKKGAASLSKDAEKQYAEKLGVELTNRVVQFFNKNGKRPPYYKDLLIETASQLLDDSKSDGAILAFENVIKLNPKNEDNPRIYSQIVDILQQAGRLEETRSKNHELIRRFGKNSRWYKSVEGNVKAQQFALDAVRDAMLSLAVFYHTNAKQLREAGSEQDAVRDFRRAAALYARYLKEFPERDDSHKAIFYFAEAAYELKRYTTALEAYQLLKEYPLPMLDNIRRDATFNIVFTFRYVIEDEAKKGRFKEIDFDALTSKSRGTEREEIPPLGLKYLNSIDEFLKIAPYDEQVPVLLFHAAAIYYVYGHSDEAYGRFSFIVDSYPKTPAALVAGRLIIDDAVSREDWTRVAEIAKRYKEQNLGGQKGDFARVEEGARFKIARALFEQANELHKNNQLSEAKAKYRESAVLFQELLAQNPKNPFADVMLLNAARATAQSGTTSAALPLFKKLYTEYPNSEYAKSARFQEALGLEKMLKFSAAAVAYDGLIRQDPQSEEAADAMLNKALLYEAADDLVNANAAFLAFAKKYPNRPEAPDALLTSASIYKKTGKISQQIAMLEQFIQQYAKDPKKRPAVIEASSQVSDSYEDLARSAKAPAQKKHYEKLRMQYNNKVLALYSSELNSPIAAFYAAKARLLLEAPEQEAFRTMRIDSRSGDEQGKQLTAMMKKLTELAKNNENIIRVYAQPVWNAESMRRIGALYEHLATRMVKAPCPKEVRLVDEFACDEYAVLLEDKAAVLEDKALQAYQQAYEIAMTAYDAPTDLVAKIQVALNRMRPGKYQRVGDVIELPKTGTLFGQGRMLSNGRMASSLHPNEEDPDVAKKVEEPAPAKNEELIEAGEKPAEEMEKVKEEADEDFEESDEDFE